MNKKYESFVGIQKHGYLHGLIDALVQIGDAHQDALFHNIVRLVGINVIIAVAYDNPDDPIFEHLERYGY